MTDAWNRIEKEKQDRILNAALGVFARDGYEKASTNEIVSRAGISKGLLFHYFGSKEELYSYLRKWSIEYAVENIAKKLDCSNRDFFKRIEKAVELKISVMEDYPALFEFVLMDDSRELSLIFDKYRSIWVDNIDTSLFRADIRFEDAVEMINWVLWGVGQKYWHVRVDDRPDTDMIRRESLKYLELLRKLFYI